MKYKKIALGGTFDLFHAGHRALLTHASKLSPKVIIGVVSDQFAIDMNKKCIWSFKERRLSIEKFLNNSNLNSKFEIIKIHDLFGPTIDDRKIEALIVGEDTVDGAMKINGKRQKMKLKSLKIEVFPHFYVSNTKISSTFIKNGIIDREGFNIRDYLLNNNFSLPSELRENLTKPYGKILRKVPLRTRSLIISVGDKTTADFMSRGIFPDLAIVDLQIQRKRAFGNVRDIGFDDNYFYYFCENKKGTISRNLSLRIAEALSSRKPSAIVVDGEEDLATLPCVLLAPLSSYVYYGLRGVGLIEVFVDIFKKDLFLNVLKNFNKH